ncbi:MAG: serine/threonine-protein kinase, partial [Gemmatimonadetes bacterium]|nr:serine/threonine-protein kinase [Gemmatimonadota bacterium]
MSELPAQLSEALRDRYRLVRELGEGGMATVYLARDVRHERDVAIKVLKPELGAVLGVERFLAEIRVTANLQHPNLLPLFDSGEAAGLLFYVMPFVDGETLRTRLERERQLPVEEAVRLAVAVAQALEHAHRRGVVHRDLKPENILLRDGQPLVADFGIALAVSNAGGQRVTQTGLSLGTPQYMSPEQATGDRAVDARADLYALGAITYEMLTGEPPHSGATAQAVIARLLTEEARPLTVLRRTVPVHVDATVRQALEKLPADRFASAEAFAQALQGRGDPAALARHATAGAGTARRGRPGVREAAAWGVAAVALAAFAWSRTRAPALPDTPVVRAVIDVPAGENVMIDGFRIVVAPQGDRLAYVTAGSLGYRTMVQRTSELTARTELARRALRNVTFSPDGRWIAYSEGLEVRRMPVEGGEHTALATLAVDAIDGMAWTPGDELVVGSGTGLYVLPARGGAPRLQPGSADRRGARYPLVMPDGRTVVVRTGGLSEAGLRAFTLPDGEVRDIAVRAERVLGFRDGHLIIHALNGALAAVPFDAGAMRATGDPFQLADDGRGYGLSGSGTMTYLSGAAGRQLVLARSGGETMLREVVGAYATPRFSPDGRRIAVAVGFFDEADIWVLDVSAGTFTRITTGGTSSVPEWTADGRRILFKSVVDGRVRMMTVPADGSGTPELLFDAGVPLNEAVLSTDGRWLVVRTGPQAANRPRDILAVDLTGNRTLIPMAVGPTSELMPRLSPDGRWLAYQSDISGTFEVYVRPFPGDGPRVKVSEGGGTEPLWSRDGRTVFYRSSEGITAVAVTPGATFGVGARRLALPTREPPSPTHPSYDVA